MTTLYRTDAKNVPARATELFGECKLEEMGSEKYNTKAIAARIRADIKTAIGEELIRKGVKVSTRMRDHNCIMLTITKAPFLLQNPAAIIQRKAVSDISEWTEEPLAEETQKILNILQLIQLQYNYDYSDSQTDYFNVNFYCYVSISSDLEYAEQDGILALAAQGLNVKAAA